MTYLEHVTTYFVSLVGRGTSLSSRDIDLVSQWEAESLPAGDVCAAIRSAFERSQKPSRFRLSDSERAVDKLRPSASTIRREIFTTPWTPSRLLETLTQLGQQTEEGPVRAAYRALYRYLRHLPEHELAVGEVVRLDQMAVSCLEDELPRSTVSRARSTARSQTRKLLSPAASEETREVLAAALLERHYCEKYDLVVPSTLLSEESEP